jgi:hypothetical protein
LPSSLCHQPPHRITTSIKPASPQLNPHHPSPPKTPQPATITPQTQSQSTEQPRMHSWCLDHFKVSSNIT